MINSILKRFTFLTIAALGLVVAAGFAPFKKQVPNNGFAVIELFTSEGCSSCPPADDLIAKIQNEHTPGHVYILAYHVDYWNNADWKDRFSNAKFTQRQLHYAEQLKIADGPYTPQAIINGMKEVIGSDEKQVRKGVDEALNNAPHSVLDLKDPIIKNGDITLAYQTKGDVSHTSLQLALVQKNAVTKVLKGENKGRTLSHIQIVKSIQTITPSENGSGTAHIALNPIAALSNFEVIGFLQDVETGKITAATRLPLGTK